MARSMETIKNIHSSIPGIESEWRLNVFSTFCIGLRSWKNNMETDVAILNLNRIAKCID